MIVCLRTRVRKQSIFALYFEFETVLKFYNLGALPRGYKTFSVLNIMSLKLIMLIHAKMPTSVGILTFISMINTIICISNLVVL